jgi:nucleoside-diphosphate-sugar epimerase
MRVLVTGASGYLGRHVVASLLDAGIDVHAVARRPSTGVGASWHCADLLDPAPADDLVRAVAPTHLLHLAWCSEHGSYWSDPANLDWVAATLRLARAFERAGGQRMVVAGTSAEYQWGAPGGGVLDERSSPLHPASLYGWAKLSTEQVVSAFARRAGLSVAWGAVFFSFGPYEDKARLVPSVIRSLLASRRVTLRSGPAVRDFLDVRDVAAGLVALLRSEVTGRVNVASGVGTAVAAVAHRVGVALGRDDLIDAATSLPEGEAPAVVAAVSRLRDEVGFAPRISLDEGLADAVRYWREVANPR